MPLIPFIIHTSKGPKATIGVCSEEALKHYEINMEHRLFDYPIPVKWLIEHLKTKSIEVDIIDTGNLGIAENGHLMLSKDAIHIDIFDVKSICEKFALDYDTLIDAYAEHLKKL